MLSLLWIKKDISNTSADDYRGEGNANQYDIILTCNQKLNNCIITKITKPIQHEWQKQLVIISFIFYPKHFRVFAS